MSETSTVTQSRWSVYMIRCGDQSLYTGISNDVDKRFSAHTSKHPKSAKYLRSRHPLQLAYVQEIGTRSLASRAEVLIKRLPKYKKEALVQGKLKLVELIDLNRVASA